MEKPTVCISFFFLSGIFFSLGPLLICLNCVCLRDNIYHLHTANMQELAPGATRISVTKGACVKHDLTGLY